MLNFTGRERQRQVEKGKGRKIKEEAGTGRQTQAEASDDPISAQKYTRQMIE